MDMDKVLVSLKPQYCKMILDGQKTVEIRKNFPKSKLPFKSFIYCTAPDPKQPRLIKTDNELFFENQELAGSDGSVCNGQVIGKFIVNHVYEFASADDVTEEILKLSCLTREEIREYAGGSRVFAWIIRAAFPFQKPVPLTNFGMSRPPQSWRYLKGAKD